MLDEFSVDWELEKVITYEPRLCTLHELQTVYSLKDFYDFLEIIDKRETLAEEARKRAERESKHNKGMNR